MTVNKYYNLYNINISCGCPSVRTKLVESVMRVVYGNASGDSLGNLLLCLGGRAFGSKLVTVYYLLIYIIYCMLEHRSSFQVADYGKII